MMTLIDYAIQRFYDYSKVNARRELSVYYGWTEEQFELEMQRRTYERLEGEQVDMKQQSALLFYEKEKMSAGRCLLGEVWHGRKRLKTRMTLESIAKRMEQSFEELDVVDYGAGSGSIGLPLAWLGANVDMYEMGANKDVLFDRKAGLGLKNVTIKHPYLDTLSWDRSKSIIVCYETLEHVHDPLSYIVIFNRALKAGGLLYLTYSFGPGHFTHLEENQVYHGTFHLEIPKYGFSEELERKDKETLFPIRIFRKEKNV